MSNVQERRQAFLQELRGSERGLSFWRKEYPYTKEKPVKKTNEMKSAPQKQHPRRAAFLAELRRPFQKEQNHKVFAWFEDDDDFYDEDFYDDDFS